MFGHEDQLNRGDHWINHVSLDFITVHMQDRPLTLTDSGATTNHQARPAPNASLHYVFKLSHSQHRRHRTKESQDQGSCQRQPSRVDLACCSHLSLDTLLTPHTHRVKPLSGIAPICGTGGSLHPCLRFSLRTGFANGRLLNLIFNAREEIRTREQCKERKRWEL